MGQASHGTNRHIGITIGGGGNPAGIQLRTRPNHLPFNKSFRHTEDEWPVLSEIEGFRLRRRFLNAQYCRPKCTKLRIPHNGIYAQNVDAIETYD